MFLCDWCLSLHFFAKLRVHEWFLWWIVIFGIDVFCFQDAEQTGAFLLSYVLTCRSVFVKWQQQGTMQSSAFSA